MDLIDMKCPHCGADLPMNKNAKECICEYCGSRMMIDTEIMNGENSKIEESGHQLARRRMRDIIPVTAVIKCLRDPDERLIVLYGIMALCSLITVLGMLAK